MQSCIMPGLPKQLVQLLDVGTVCIYRVSSLPYVSEKLSDDAILGTEWSDDEATCQVEMTPLVQPLSTHCLV